MSSLILLNARRKTSQPSHNLCAPVFSPALSLTLGFNSDNEHCELSSYAHLLESLFGAISSDALADLSSLRFGSRNKGCKGSIGAICAAISKFPSPYHEVHQLLLHNHTLVAQDLIGISTAFRAGAFRNVQHLSLSKFIGNCFKDIGPT